MPAPQSAADGEQRQTAVASRPAVIRNGATSTAPDPWRIRGLIAVMALLLYGLDQWTKHVAETNLTIGEPIPVIDGLLWWSLHYNPGAAFSMGTQFTVVLSVLSLAVLIAVVTVVIPRVRNWLLAIPVGWLLAGVAGNLTDRLFREPGPFFGHVVDFIAVRSFAIFNVADMCITGAAILFIIWSLRQDRGR